MEYLRSLVKSYGQPFEFPMGIVGSPARQVKMNTTLPIRRVTSAEETADLIANYTGIRAMDFPLIIEDLAFLSPQTLQQLLKFLEESKISIVLLATYDVFTAPILSRLKVFIKSPLEKTSSNFLSPAVGTEKIESQLSKDTHPLDRIRHQGKESPILFYNDRTIPGRPNRKKILSLLE